jgi:predicted metal-dependent phosphoesterase TrpH
MAKCDMHLHSCFSKELLFEENQDAATQWYEHLIRKTRAVATGLKKGKSKKWSVHFTSSFEPKQLYDTAMKNGMDFFCLTDHNTINGWKELLKKYPKLKAKIIPGMELTSKIPGKKFEIHVNIYGLNEKQSIELKKISGNVADVAKYCKKEKLICSVNHLGNSFLQRKIIHQKGDMKKEISYLLKIFKILESRNGHAGKKTNEMVEKIAADNKKIMIAGTDSHIGDAGLTWTEVPGAKTKEEFLNGIRYGKAVIGGEHGSFEKIKKEILVQITTNSGIYYTDGVRNFDKKLDVWSEGFVKGIFFFSIEKTSKLFIRLFAGKIAKWVEKKGL